MKNNDTNSDKEVRFIQRIRVRRCTHGRNYKNAKTNSISTSNQFKCYSSKLVNNAKTLIKSDARET